MATLEKRDDAVDIRQWHKVNPGRESDVQRACLHEQDIVGVEHNTQLRSAVLHYSLRVTLKDGGTWGKVQADAATVDTLATPLCEIYPLCCECGFAFIAMQAVMLSVSLLAAWPHHTLVSPQNIPQSSPDDSEISIRLLKELQDAKDHLAPSNHTWAPGLQYYGEEGAGPVVKM